MTGVRRYRPTGAVLWRLAAGAAVGALALPAQAAGVDGLAPYAATGIGWVAFTAAGVAVLVVNRRLSRERQRRDETQGALESLYAALAGAGAALFVWSRPDGRHGHSPGLAPLLGAGNDGPIDFTALRERLEPDSSRNLNAAVARLRETGKQFHLSIVGKDGTPLRAQGFRLGAGTDANGADGRTTEPQATDNPAPCLDVLWLQRDEETAAIAARLESERRRLQQMLDSMPIPVWARNGDLSIVDCNATYARAVEAKSSKQVVTDGIEFAGSVISEAGKGLARHAIETGTPQSEMHHIVVDGSRRLFDLTEVPLGEGAVAGFAIDVTGVEEAESELARHVASHAEVLENLATAIAIYGPDRRLKFFNSAYVRLWQLEESWLHAGPHFEEVLEAQRDRRLLPETADFPAFKRERVEFFTLLLEPHEELVHLPDGRTLRMIISPHPMGGLMFTFEDVTDRLALERSYNTLIDVQRETLDNLAEAVAVFGGDGRLKLFTPTLERMWRLQPEFLAAEPHMAEILDRLRYLFRYGEDWDSFKATVLGRLARRVLRRGRIERTDDKVLDYGMLPLPDGGVLVTSIDITDSTRVSRALRERNEALEAADRLKSEFIANVSYELRTPLNTIMGFVEILGHEYYGLLNERQKEYTQGILESSEELLSLINDILDLAMIEAGSMTLDLDRVAIRALLDSVVQLTAERAKQKGLVLTLDCPDDIGMLEMDERRIRHALLNLVGNAAEFTPAGGTITVSAERLDSEVALSVTDSGVGIPEAEQPLIFDLFVRGKRPRGGSRGAGLGLSLVRSFVDLHGGRVDIESKPDEGTRVTCYLPVARAGGRAALTADLFPGKDVSARHR